MTEEKEPVIEQTKAVKIADLLEDSLIEALAEDDPKASILNVARQYLKDQGFVAGKRPNAAFHKIAGATHAPRTLVRPPRLWIARITPRHAPLLSSTVAALPQP